MVGKESVVDSSIWKPKDFQRFLFLSQKNCCIQEFGHMRHGNMNAVRTAQRIMRWNQDVY